ncbi:MAG: hypothetical protein IRZ00_16710 [Gemmatimonadetes bacterium]|nr:hypothetical protein [Gemmatimonadota bacterium]
MRLSFTPMQRAGVGPARLTGGFAAAFSAVLVLSIAPGLQAQRRGDRHADAPNRSGPLVLALDAQLGAMPYPLASDGCGGGNPVIGVGTRVAYPAAGRLRLGLGVAFAKEWDVAHCVTVLRPIGDTLRWTARDYPDRFFDRGLVELDLRGELEIPGLHRARALAGAGWVASAQRVPFALAGISWRGRGRVRMALELNGRWYRIPFSDRRVTYVGDPTGPITPIVETLRSGHEWKGAVRLQAGIEFPLWTRPAPRGN